MNHERPGLLHTRAFWLGLNVVVCVAWFVRARAVFPSLPPRIPVHWGAEGVTWAAPTLGLWMMLPQLAVLFLIGSAVMGSVVARFPGMINGLPREWQGDLPDNDRQRLQRYVKLIAAQWGLVCSLVLLIVHASFEYSARTVSENGASSASFPALSMVGCVVAVLFVSVVPMMIAVAQFPTRSASPAH